MDESVEERLCVLVLDDSEIILKAAVKAFGICGFNVVTASSLMEFDRLVSERNPDVILADIKMPDVSGDHICRVLKINPQTRSTPIVLFSAIEEDELARLAKECGADGYIPKKAGMAEIIDYVEQIALARKSQ